MSGLLVLFGDRVAAGQALDQAGPPQTAARWIVGGGQAAEDLIKVLEASPINEPTSPINEPTSLIIMNKPSCHSETISTKLRY